MTMDLDLAGERVLSTGASHGIGLAIAESFLREGARVALLARSAGPLAEVAERLTAEHGSDRVLILAADCADADAWPGILKQLESTWDGLDIAVANVGDGRSVAG